MKYAYFREDKQAEPGYSRELISMDYLNFQDETTIDELNVWPHPGIDTLIKALHRLLERKSDHPIFGTKVKTQDRFSYEWMTVKEVVDTSKLLAAGLSALNLTPEIFSEEKQWKFLGIQSKNRKEWFLSHLANIYNGGTTVGFYDTLGPDAARYMLNQCELTTLACSVDLVENMCNLKKKQIEESESTLVNLVVFESDIPPKLLQLAEEVNIQIFTFDQIISKGRENETWEASEIDTDHCCMFSYTSGTTGDPKGVKLTHKMLIQMCASVNHRLGLYDKPFNESDTYISYLPCAHSFEQALFAISLCYGMKIGFYGGDPLLLIKEDLPTLKPTLFPSVPRIFNRVYGILQEKVNAITGVKKWLVNNGINTKMENLRRHGTVTHGCYDKVIFKKFKAIFGGNVRCMITGSAPIAKDVLDFLKVCFCSPIMEGYGMTETSGGSFITFVGDPMSGHVGGPLANVKVRLKDVPEMEYYSTSTPPAGEICIQGPSIMQGYFKNPEKTAEVLQNGWIHTGDVGIVNPNGSVNIIDRVKNIFKLSQGEYIAPEKLEMVYIQSSWIAQAWVYGDSLRDFIVLIAVLDATKLDTIKKANSADKQVSPDLKQLVHADLVALALQNNLNSLEIPKNLYLTENPFTVESDILTPTFKLKRNVAKAKFQEEIDQMYEEGPIFSKNKKNLTIQTQPEKEAEVHAQS